MSATTVVVGSGGMVELDEEECKAQDDKTCSIKSLDITGY